MNYPRLAQFVGNRVLLKPVIFLGILDFNIFDHSHYFSRHLILNSENQQHNLKDLEFNFIELPKFTRQEDELTSISDKWIYFIKNASSLEHIPDNVDSEALKQAYHIAQQHRWTRNELDIYEYQGLQIGKIKGAIDTAHLEGKQEGEYEKAKKIALKAHKKGMSLEEISKFTDLSIAELRLCCTNKMCSNLPPTPKQFYAIATVMGVPR